MHVALDLNHSCFTSSEHFYCSVKSRKVSQNKGTAAGLVEEDLLVV